MSNSCGWRWTYGIIFLFAFAKSFYYHDFVGKPDIWFSFIMIEGYRSALIAYPQHLLRINLISFSLWVVYTLILFSLAVLAPYPTFKPVMFKAIRVAYHIYVLFFRCHGYLSSVVSNSQDSRRVVVQISGRRVVHDETSNRRTCWMPKLNNGQLSGFLFLPWRDAPLISEALTWVYDREIV